VCALCRGGFEHAENPVIRMVSELDNRIEIEGGTTSATCRFTPCQRKESLLKKLPRSGVGRRIWSRIWFSSVGSSFELNRNCKFSGDELCGRMKSISGGAMVKHPKIRGKRTGRRASRFSRRGNGQICQRPF
jgi:hypothetical protein